jgi:hypothetical protein
MWTYQQSTGRMVHNGKAVATGYSGWGSLAKGFRNNPAKQGVVAKGPIPQGLWKMTGVVTKHPSLGPFVILLEPVGHNALGRSLFRIHGDNAQNDASHGCVILPRNIRELIWNSGDRALTVIA